MATPPPNELRQLILKFYSENDPGKLRMGLDVNGIVEWTSRNGMNALNTMLKKQFGKGIDPQQKLGTATQQFMRMSTVLTPQAASVKVSQQAMKQNLQENSAKDQILYKLQVFYKEHDPSKLNDLDKLVTFAMYHGVRKLNSKLVSKYGVGIPEEDVQLPTNFRKEGGASPGSVPPKTPPRRKPPGLAPAASGESEEELRADVIKYYEKVDPEQLDALDAIMDWAMMIGRKELDEKLEQIYGISLDHVTRPERVEAREREESARYESEQQSRMGQPQVKQPPPQPPREGPDVREFSEMTNDEIRNQLILFYEKHDEATIEKIDQILALALKLGRAEMNEKLYDIYAESLDDVVYQAYENGDLGEDEEEYYEDEGYGEYEEEGGYNSGPYLSPEPTEKPKKKGFLGKIKNAIGGAPKAGKQGSFVDSRGGSYTSEVPPQQPQRAQGNSYYESSSGYGQNNYQGYQQDSYETGYGQQGYQQSYEQDPAEAMKSSIAQMAQKFKQRDKDDRFKKFEGGVDACDDYEIDMLGENMGACKNCGFPRMQHRNRKQRVLEIRNSKGLPSVKEMIKARNAYAKETNYKPTTPFQHKGSFHSPMPRRPKAGGGGGGWKKPAKKVVARQKSAKKNPGGPCKKFELDMLASSAVCTTCGYNKLAHTAEKRKTFQQFFAPIYHDSDDDDEESGFDDYYE